MEGSYLISTKEYLDSVRYLGITTLDAINELIDNSFDANADNIHIHNYIENLNFKKDSNSDIFCIHGDNKSTTSLASELVTKNYNSVAPETGEIYQI